MIYNLIKTPKRPETQSINQNHVILLATNLKQSKWSPEIQQTPRQISSRRSNLNWYKINQWMCLWDTNQSRSHTSNWCDVSGSERSALNHTTQCGWLTSDWCDALKMRLHQPRTCAMNKPRQLNPLTCPITNQPKLWKLKPQTISTTCSWWTQ